MTLDASTRQFLDKVAASATKPRHLMTPAEARTAFAGLRALLAKGPAMQAVRELSIPVTGGEIPVRLFVPETKPAGLLVYFHGGGWVVGTREEFDPLCREIAAGAGVAVALVEYRKAPEHPFPIPGDDAWTATRWLARKRHELLGADLPFWVGGDSAGGNLAISVTLRARDEAAPRIDGQLLVYPVTDCRFDRPSYLDGANQLMLNVDVMKSYWQHYAPDASTRLSRLASPSRETNLAGLPPAVILTAEHDVLRDEGEDYASRLQDAGVAVEFERFTGQIHGFLMMLGILPGSADGVRFVCAAMRRMLARMPA